MYVVATAGHIDHGKSTLVKALTGIDPDRLPEEKSRGLTIDLGFAWLNLPSGEAVGIVDVPGHERFIKNMVAGVGFIDAVMFVVAADDGWMPQSTEHLQILSLLQVKTGIVVVTKTDLVSPAQLEAQRQNIRGRLRGTFLEKAPIIDFSATTGVGKELVIAALHEVLKRVIGRTDLGSPRLYIDRCFAMKGMGTVVTGTLVEGRFHVGQEVEVCPLGRKVRIRGLQTHKAAVEVAVPGSRVAANISGCTKEELERGYALVLPGHFRAAAVLGIDLSLLPDCSHPLHTGGQFQFLLGTVAVMANIKLLRTDRLAPGSSDLALAYLVEPICLRVGDKFILRSTGPPRTIGGGVVLDWYDQDKIPAKSKVAEVLSRRQNLRLESVVDSELVLVKGGSLDPERIRLNSPFTRSQIDEYLSRASNVVLAGRRYIEKSGLERHVEPALEILSEYHRQRPWLEGMTLGDLARKLRITTATAGELVDYLCSTGMVMQQSGYIKLPGHMPHLLPYQEELAGRLHAVLSARPLASPLKKEFIAENPAYEVVIDYLRDKGELVELNGGVLLPMKEFQRIIEKVVGLLRIEGQLTASQIKDHLGTTRKYVIPLLEKLDSLGITRRQGDLRSLGDNV